MFDFEKILSFDMNKFKIKRKPNTKYYNSIYIHGGLKLNIFKKILSLIIISILLFHSTQNTPYAISDISPKNPLKIVVFLTNFNDQFISNIKKNL